MALRQLAVAERALAETEPEHRDEHESAALMHDEAARQHQHLATLYDRQDTPIRVVSRERRWHRPSSPAGLFMNCRLCWQRIRLQPERVVLLDDGLIAYQCQYCESSCLIRTDDAVALGVRPKDS